MLARLHSLSYRDCTNTSKHKKLGNCSNPVFIAPYRPTGPIEPKHRVSFATSHVKLCSRGLF